MVTDAYDNNNDDYDDDDNNNNNYYYYNLCVIKYHTMNKLGNGRMAALILNFGIGREW
jgi:hypothetical protein